MLAAILGTTEERIGKDRSVFGPLLETFAFAEVMKQVDWLAETCRLYHYRDKDQDGVDIIVEGEGGDVVGIEVKAAATDRRIFLASGEINATGPLLFFTRTRENRTVPRGPSVIRITNVCEQAGKPFGGVKACAMFAKVPTHRPHRTRIIGIGRVQTFFYRRCSRMATVPFSDDSRGVSGVRVLVVEDFAPFRQFICAMLTKNPALLVLGEASDGLDGVHKAAELKPDLILLDIGVPSLNGIEAARQIADFPRNPK